MTRPLAQIVNVRSELFSPRRRQTTSCVGAVVDELYTEIDCSYRLREAAAGGIGRTKIRRSPAESEPQRLHGHKSNQARVKLPMRGMGKQADI